MKLLRHIHLFGGILIVIIFTLTGQYMHHNYDHLKDMELMNRALFRAGHLYILLFGLINMGLGAYFKGSNRRGLRTLQFIASLLIIGSSMMMIYSFFTELPTQTIERPIARFGLYIVLAGVSLHGFVSLMHNSNTPNH